MNHLRQIITTRKETLSIGKCENKQQQRTSYEYEECLSWTMCDLRGCAVDVSRGDGTEREDSLENEVPRRCRLEMLNSTTVALNLANTRRYKPQSCRSPDKDCFPEMARTAMIRKDLQEERATRERVSYLDIKRRIQRKKFLRTHTYVTLEPTHARSTIHKSKSSATEN